MAFPIAVLVFTCLANLVLALFILFKNPKDKVGQAFLAMAILISAWASANFLTNVAPDLLLNKVFNRLSFLFAFLAMVSAALFSTLFVNKEKRRTIKYWLINSFFVLVIGILSATPYVAGKVYKHNGTLTFTVGQLLILYIVAILFYLAVVIKNFSKLLRHGSMLEKTQAKIIIIGFTLGVLIGLFTNAILPLFSSSWNTVSLGPPLLSFFIVGCHAYAIIRHKLFDIRSAVARSVAYVLTLVIIAFVYIITTVFSTSYALHSPLHTPSIVVLVIITFIVSFTFQPLKLFFDRLTNRIFYQDAYDPQEFIDQLNQAIVSDIRLKSLLKKCSEVIAENMKVDFVLFALKATEDLPEQVIGTTDKSFHRDDINYVRQTTPYLKHKIIVTDELEADQSKLKRELSKYGIGVLARLATDLHEGVEGIGYIVLGYKKSGNPYNGTDIRILEIISNELVIAIQNAMQFEEIQQFNITLQKRIKEATAELERTNKRLVALDEAKDEFISMASHQLRTPLTSVKGFISMLLDGDFGKITPKQKGVLKEAFASSQRMVFLIADFLNVSRIKTGKFLIETSEVNLPEIVRQEMEQLEEMAQSRQLKLTYHPPSDFPKVMLDENKIRQVMMNFVDNAIYYTKAGGKIEIQLYATAREVIYKVIDNGIGVPKTEQHRLFTKFFRAKNAQQARPDGTGLGLFMAQKVIVAQGGSVIFESTENKGSIFGFRFPLSKIQAKES